MKEKEIKLKLEGTKAKVVYHAFRGTKLNTLLVSFEERRRALSTLDGFRDVNHVANTFIPDGILEHTVNDFQEFKENFPQTAFGIPADEITFLGTGVSMDDLAVYKKSYQEFTVYCLATAGVKGNAMRTGVDETNWIEKNGKYEKTVGTINTILLTNVPLNDGSLARAVITATEAKTAALQDLDVRSTYDPQNQATGTGTDNVIVASGKMVGKPLWITGGHTKMSELIGVSTKTAITEAIKKHHFQFKKI
jgi:adenosylcobinamide amidohydrolase